MRYKYSIAVAVAFHHIKCFYVMSVDDKSTNHENWLTD